MARRSRSKGSRSAGVFLFLLGLFGGAGILYLFIKPSGGAPRTSAEEPPAAVPKAEAPRASHPARHRPAPATAASDHVEPEMPAAMAGATPVAETLPPPSGPLHGIRVALVIDDLGHDVDDLRPLAALGVPVTYSVLPFEDQTPQ